MKLIVILSVIAYGYAAKLDRTYLPPENAATAGGSPGSLATPFGSAGKPLEQPSGQFGFGQPSGPSASGQPAAPSGFAPSPGSGLGSPAGPTKFNKPTESSGFPSGPANFGSPAGTVQPNQPSGSSSFGQRPIASTGFGKSPVTPQLDKSPNAFGLGPARQPTNNAGLPSGPSQFSQPSGSPTFRQQSSNVGVPSGKQAFGTPASQSGFSPSLDGSNDKTPVFGIGSQGAQGASGYAGNDNQQPERPQAAADRNAEILRYDNENDGENYAYSFETSNGIAAEESGVATNGVQAQGAFSYTGDDGQFYQVSYTADENGFVPQGDHLPTPPPIPDEILKSLEVNAKAAAAGTQEGAYRPEEDESDTPQPIGSIGTTSYNQPQGQDQPSNQYGTPGYNRPQSQGGSSGTPSYSGPQSQIPNRQYGAPSQTLQGQDQAGNQGRLDQSRNTVQSTGRQYNAPVSTKAQSLVPQKPGSYNQGNAANGGYSYDQPQSQGQGSKPESSFSNAGSIPTGPQGSSNAGIQGQTTQYSGSPSYNQGDAPNNGFSSFQNKGQDLRPQFGPSGTNSIPAGTQRPINNGIQGQTSQHFGSPSKNRGNAPNGGYNYNQPQNQEQNLRSQSSTGSIPTRQQGSSNGIKGQTSNFGGSPSYSQGNAPNGGYNYNQAENRGQGPKPQFGSLSTGLISTGSQESSNAVTQEQPQFSGSPSYSQDSNAQNTGFNYNQPEFSGKGPKSQGIPNANDQGKINQQGQGRGLGYQTTSPGNNNVAFPNQSKGTVTTESQVQGGYQYNRPSSGGLSQLGTNEGKINQRPAFAPQGQQTTGTQEFNKPFSNGASPKGSRPQPFGPITSGQGPQGPTQSAFDSNGQDSTGPISATNQNQFGVTVTSQKGSQPQSFNSIPSGQGAQGTSRPSFGQVSTGIANQNQFGSPASSAPRPFMPQSAPYQYKQPSGQGSQFPQQTQTGTKEDSSTFDGDRSEFGGPRQPPSFSPEEGYKY